MDGQTHACGICQSFVFLPFHTYMLYFLLPQEGWGFSSRLYFIKRCTLKGRVTIMKGQKGRKRKNNNDSVPPPKKGSRNKQQEGGPSASGEQVRLITYYSYLRSKLFSRDTFYILLYTLCTTINWFIHSFMNSLSENFTPPAVSVHSSNPIFLSFFIRMSMINLAFNCPLVFRYRNRCI